MVRVIKTIRSRQYYYEQTSTRVNGKVKTISRYIGPLYPRRKKGQGGFILFGLASMAVHAAKGTLHKPGPIPYPDRHRAPDPRTMVHQHNHFFDLAQRDPKAAIADIQGRSRAATYESGRLGRGDAVGTMSDAELSEGRARNRMQIADETRQHLKEHPEVAERHKAMDAYTRTMHTQYTAPAVPDTSKTAAPAPEQPDLAATEDATEASAKG